MNQEDALKNINFNINNKDINNNFSNNSYKPNDLTAVKCSLIKGNFKILNEI